MIGQFGSRLQKKAVSITADGSCFVIAGVPYLETVHVSETCDLTALSGESRRADAEDVVSHLIWFRKNRADIADIHVVGLSRCLII